MRCLAFFSLAVSEDLDDEETRTCGRAGCFLALEEAGVRCLRVPAVEGLPDFVVFLFNNLSRIFMVKLWLRRCVLVAAVRLQYAVYHFCKRAHYNIVHRIRRDFAKSAGIE